MNLPKTSPLFAFALLVAMGLAFAYQGLSAHAPPSFLAAVIFFGGAIVVPFWVRHLNKKREG